MFCLDQVIEGENEYPNKVNEVPVQTDFLNHFVVSSSFVGASHDVDPDDDVDDNAAEYVETMETGYDEEQGGKRHRTRDVVGLFPMHMVTKTKCSSFLKGFICQTESIVAETATFTDELSPFPGLTTEECQTTEDSQEHVFGHFTF